MPNLLTSYRGILRDFQLLLPVLPFYISFSQNGSVDTYFSSTGLLGSGSFWCYSAGIGITLACTQAKVSSEAGGAPSVIKFQSLTVDLKKLYKPN
jgi:hypothetical protein